MQKGKPLPEKGTCKHYKQSHRWLRCHHLVWIMLIDLRGGAHCQIFTALIVSRFPCCGRSYPCDVCHDEDQDHPMELATRMICGYCAKEQVSCWPDALITQKYIYQQKFAFCVLYSSYFWCVFVSNMQSGNILLPRHCVMLATVLHLV